MGGSSTNYELQLGTRTGIKFVHVGCTFRTSGRRRKKTCKYPTNGAAAKKPAGYEATVFVGAARALKM